MKVVIHAGGFGSRLLEETRDKVKAMVEIGCRPILSHIMMHYGAPAQIRATAGFSLCIVLAMYGHNSRKGAIGRAVQQRPCTVEKLGVAGCASW